MNDWDGYINGCSDGHEEVAYNHATINDRMLGFGDPIRIRDDAAGVKWTRHSF